jgi:hypothetical protein
LSKSHFFIVSVELSLLNFVWYLVGTTPQKIFINFLINIMKKIYFFLSVLLSVITLTTKAQLAGNFNVPGNFPSIAAAISALNTQGVSGPANILISTGYSELAPLGGFSLTATGTSVNPITFQKSGTGNNPLLYAYTGGTATPASTTQDGIWRFIGSDYITIDGINLVDTNSFNPATMEFGYGFF